MFGTGSLGKGWGCGGLADFWKIRFNHRDFLEDKSYGQPPSSGEAPALTFDHFRLEFEAHIHRFSSTHVGYITCEYEPLTPTGSGRTDTHVELLSRGGGS